MSEQSFATPQPVRVELKLAAGNIEVATADQKESSVRIDGPQKSAEAIKAELVGDRLVIQQTRKSLFSVLGRFEDSIRVSVLVPSGSRAEIMTAAGESVLDGTFAGLELKSASGGVVVSGEVDGPARVKTVSGEVRLPHVGGDLLVQTVSGDLVADAVEGSVFARSVSGDIRVGSLRAGNVDVKSVSGDVELGIAAGTNIDVDAGSASGALSSEVPLSDTPADAAGPAVVIRGNTVSGDFRVVRAA